MLISFSILPPPPRSPQDPHWVLSVLSWMLEVARTLVDLHALKPAILHRDLKPANIMLDQADRVKVCVHGYMFSQLRIHV